MRLEELRSKIEFIDYFKKLNIDITNEQIDYLKEKYNKKNHINSNILNMEQLNNIAGGLLWLEKRYALARFFTGKDYILKYSPNFGENPTKVHRTTAASTDLHSGLNPQQSAGEASLQQPHHNLPRVLIDDEYFAFEFLTGEPREVLIELVNGDYHRLAIDKSCVEDVKRLRGKVIEYENLLLAANNVRPEKHENSIYAANEISQPHVEDKGLGEGAKIPTGLNQSEARPGITCVLTPETTTTTTNLHHEQHSDSHHKLSIIAKEMDADVIMLTALKMSKSTDETFKFLAFDPKNDGLRKYTLKNNRGLTMYEFIANDERISDKTALELLFADKRLLLPTLNKFHFPNGGNSNENQAFIRSYLDTNGNPVGALKQFLDNQEFKEGEKDKVLKALKEINISFVAFSERDQIVNSTFRDFIVEMTKNKTAMEEVHKAILNAIKLRLMSAANVNEKYKKNFTLSYDNTNGKIKIAHKDKTLAETGFREIDKLDKEAIVGILEFIKQELAKDKNFLEKFFGSLCASAGKSMGSTIGKKFMELVFSAGLGALLLHFLQKLFEGNSDNDKK